MLQPNYNFYVGRQCSGITWSIKSTINTSGQVIVGFDTVSSPIYVQDNAEFVYLSVLYDVPIYVHFYTSLDAYIGNGYSPIINRGVIAIPKNAEYFRLVVNRFTTGLARITSGEVNFTYLTWTCKPHYSSLSKKYEQESNQMFFRASLDGKITLVGADFDRVYNSLIEDNMLFLITRDKKQYSVNTFTKTTCKFDTYKKSCELGLSPIDTYTDFLNNWENKYNLISLSPAITKVTGKIGPVIQTYIRSSNTINYFFAGTYTEEEVLEVIDDPGELKNTYHFAYIQSTNEMTVTGLDIQDANGVYAGGGAGAVWKNANGYYITAARVNIQGTQQYQVSLRLYSPQGGDSLYYSTLADDMWNSIYHGTGDETGYYFLATQEQIAMFKSGDTSTTAYIGTFIEYHIYQRILTNKTTVQSKETYELGASDMAVNNINYKRCIGLTGGNYYHVTNVSDSPTMFGIRDDGKYFTNKFIPPSAGQWRPLPVCRSTWGNSSIWYAYDMNTWPALYEEAADNLVIKDAYLIQDVISTLLKKVSPVVYHEGTSLFSTFLYGDAPLSGMARFWTAITPKSNVLKSNYDQPAQKAETSLKDILDMLATVFKCYWYIDDSYRLRIEHISFFKNSYRYGSFNEPGIDLTSSVDMFNKKPGEYFQGEIEYDTDSLVKRYEMSWVDESTELFGGLTIGVDSNYVKQDNKEEITVDDFSADIDFMIAVPDNFSEDGFALLLCDYSDSGYSLPLVTMNNIYGEDGLPFSAYIQNGYASWIYLSRFYLYDMPARNIVINRLGTGYQTVQSLVYSMTHDISFFSDNDLMPFTVIKTSLGIGLLQEFSVDIDTRLVSATVIYTPK